eukprot:m.40722 g.40722  ORF g.40722 m.40722 type:complete len:216 (+) comp5629_c0_seq1:726-1373(+)
MSWRLARAIRSSARRRTTPSRPCATTFITTLSAHPGLSRRFDTAICSLSTNADCSTAISLFCRPRQVKNRVLHEFQYQSGLELSDGAYASLAAVPLASEVGSHYRQRLISQLELYQEMVPDTLKRVADIVVKDFMPAIHMSVSAGHARVRCDQAIFREHPQAIAIANCILSERGFETSVFHTVDHVPTHVGTDGSVRCEARPVYIMEVGYPKGRR